MKPKLSTVKLFVQSPACPTQQGLKIVLSDAAEKTQRGAKSLRLLQSGEYPNVTESAGSVLESAYYISNKGDNKRGIFYGNSHAMIYPFLDKAVKEGIVELPLNDGILNIDYDADIAEYTQHTIFHEASWQRLGVDNGFWDANKSFNWRPEHSDAIPVRTFNPNRYITSIDTELAKQLAPKVLSIDLDFFNDLQQNTPAFNNYLSIVKGMVRNVKVVMVFSSRAWVQGKQSHEQVKRLVEEVTSAFNEK